LAAATRAAASAAFRRRAYPRPPGLAVAGAGIGLFVDFALVAEYEVGESYASFAVYPSSMVVVRPLRVVGSGSPLPVARIKVSELSHVLVVVDAVVTGLAVLESVRRGHL